jgi:hypothetical protein
MGVFNFTDKDFTGGSTLYENGEYLFEIDDVREEPKANKPSENNLVIDFKGLGSVGADGSIVEQDENGLSFAEYRPIRNWYSAPWTILPLLTALGHTVTPGQSVECSNDTLKGLKVFLTISKEPLTRNGQTKMVNKIQGYRPYQV